MRRLQTIAASISTGEICVSVTRRDACYTVIAVALDCKCVPAQLMSIQEKPMKMKSTLQAGGRKWGSR
jgi:hypothetical protein